MKNNTQIHIQEQEKLSFSFSSFPSWTIKNQFWILSPKSFKTVDPLERSEKTSPAIGYKIIPQGCQSNFPFQNSSVFTQTHSSPSPPPKSRRAGRGKSEPLYAYSRVCTALGRPPEDETQKSQGQHAREGICSGQLCSHVLQQPQPHQQAMPELSTLGRKDEFTSILQNQGEAGNSEENVIIESNLLPCYAAVCTFQLIKPKDCSGGGGISQAKSWEYRRRQGRRE